MNNQLPTFMVCENPMIDQQREFVMHMQEPFFLAEVFFHENQQDQETFGKQMHVLAESGEIPAAIMAKDQIDEDYFSVMAIHFFSEIDATEHETLNTVINNMADWYKSYLQWEEENDPFNE